MDPPDEATEGGLPEDSPLEEQSAGATEGKEDPDSRKGTVRKRTKTGCLTCRKRRIKCDEGKPTCNNCIKSKRPCDGYNQRLTFKEPINAFHHAAHFSHPVYQYQQSAEPMLGPQLSAAHSKSSSSQAPLPIIAPKPPPLDFSNPMPSQFGQSYQGQPGPSTPIPPLGFSPTQFSPQDPLVPSFFQPSGPAAVQPHLEVDDFFQTLPAAESHNATGPIKQEPFASERGHLMSPASRHPPPTAEYAGTQVAGSVPQEPEYWNSDDEASMVDSDDDDNALFESQTANLESNDLGIQVARRANALNDFYGTQLRTFTGFVDANGVLATYTPSSTNSPLNDSQTAAVFWYFVNVTGPSISLYERHPLDPSPMFQGQPVPKVRQHIWTYTFPIISLNHPALLQAILALGSLQMAKLQGVPATASMKHYHLSIRRIAKNYRSPHRRTQAATLAATLLLGFFEVWNSDHDKWCKHMWGARAIIKEIPFRKMTKAMLALKREQRRIFLETQNVHQQPDGFFPGLDDGEPDITHVDLDLLSQLSGSPVTYDDYGYVHGDGHQQSTGWHTERDVESYGQLADLYWWYCKMDVYQSILGGTRLFMEYDLWTQCVPRGPIGRIDAIFGTYDHLMLLQGRLANFAGRDLARKRQARKAESAGKGHHQSPQMFSGLIPFEHKFTVPTGFSPPPEPSTPIENPEDMDIEASTAAALREWEAIRQAFDVFRANLGPDFDPMGPEMGPPQQTPFGPARTYRTYGIAGIWMGYHMGQVVLHRAHPSMPPVAMVAAGMAAQHTARYAYEIGMIAAGLTDDDCDSMTEVSTTLGAAFIECCFCLFVAGVQYQDPAHRHWTIKRLHNIARLTGWQSARQIADGCESAWTKAAQFGRGAPYQRSPDLDLLVPPSVWTNPRRIDHKIRELDRDEGKYVLTKSEQAHYALGLLSVEHDLDRLELEDKA